MRTLIQVAAVLGVTIATFPAAAQVPGENALPSSTVALFKVRDASDLRSALESSQLGQLIADPAMDELKEDIGRKLEEVNAEVRKRLGVTLLELLETPQGPAWLAITQRDDAFPVSVLVAADAGEKTEQMAEIMANATEQLETEAGGKVTTETFKNLTLQLIQPPEENPPLVWAQDGSVFYISIGADALKDLLANADGREDALAANSGFRAVNEEIDNDALMTWYVDLRQVVQLAVQAANEGGGGDAGQIEAILQILGLNQLQAVGGSVDIASGDYDTIARTYIHAPGQKTGLVRVFPMPPIDTQAEPWVPASTSTYSTLSWDLDAAFVAAQDLVNQFLPGAIENVEQGLVGPNGEQFQFQRDIFGPLGNRITIISDYKTGGAEISQDDQRALFALALEDASAFQNTLNKLISISGANPKKRDFQGTTIYDFELPELPAQPGMNVNLDGDLSVAIAKDHLFASGNPTLLEQVLRGGPAIGDDEEFRSVIGQMPGQVSSFSFSRPDESARAVYNMFKSGQIDEAFEQANAAGGEDVPDFDNLIDVDKIPEFSVFAKYLTQSGSYWEMSEDGLTITQFTLRKANP